MHEPSIVNIYFPVISSIPTTVLQQSTGKVILPICVFYLFLSVAELPSTWNTFISGLQKHMKVQVHGFSHLKKLTLSQSDPGEQCSMITFSSLP